MLLVGSKRASPQVRKVRLSSHSGKTHVLHHLWRARRLTPLHSTTTTRRRSPTSTNNRTSSHVRRLHHTVAPCTPWRSFVRVCIYALCVCAFSHVCIHMCECTHVLSTRVSVALKWVYCAGPAPILRDPVNPTIPYGGIPKSSPEYPFARADSRRHSRDGSQLFLVDEWALKLSSQHITGDIQHSQQ